MRKVNLLRCDIARDASMQDLFSELSDTRVALSQAYARLTRSASRSWSTPAYMRSTPSFRVMIICCGRSRNAAAELCAKRAARGR